VARIAAAQRYRGFGVAGRNFIRQCLLFQSWSRNSIDGLIIGFRATLRRWIARRGALRLRKLDVCSLLLASGSEKIGQDSPGGFSDGDRRWRSILRFDRLTDVGYPSEDLFGLSESFVNRGNSEVLIHVVLRRSAGGMRSSQSSLRVKEAGIAGCLARPFWCFPDFMLIDERNSIATLALRSRLPMITTCRSIPTLVRSLAMEHRDARITGARLVM
jgi:hypothetical protein